MQSITRSHKLMDSIVHSCQDFHVFIWTISNSVFGTLSMKKCQQIKKSREYVELATTYEDFQASLDIIRGLTLPALSKTFVLETDDSNYEVREMKMKERRPLSYQSKAVRPNIWDYPLLRRNCQPLSCQSLNGSNVCRDHG